MKGSLHTIRATWNAACLGYSAQRGNLCASWHKQLFINLLKRMVSNIRLVPLLLSLHRA
jgi:hypothetical protein